MGDAKIVWGEGGWVDEGVYESGGLGVVEQSGGGE